MKRRTFTKLVGLGVTSIPALQAEAQSGDKQTVHLDYTSARAGKRPEKRLLAPEPVNVFEFEGLAKKVLPKPPFDYLSTGSEDEVTLRDNVAAYRRIRLLPPLLRGVATSDLSTTVLGTSISMPVMLAPVASQCLFHRNGELDSARAAEKAQTLFAVSTSATHSVEEIAAVTKGPLWFQLYVPRDKTVARKLVERVEHLGYKAIIVTVDRGGRKEQDMRNNFNLPKEMLWRTLRNMGHDVSRSLTNEQLLEYAVEAYHANLTWDFFDWLRSITKLPLLIKGVLTAADAQKAVSLGLEGIVVSNHGGRALDGMPATIDVLAEIVAAVNSRTEVYVDGGVRRGTDVLKALALGAKATLIGRPYAWGLAVNGEAGVTKVLSMFREELQNAMQTSGCFKISDISRSLIKV